MKIQGKEYKLPKKFKEKWIKLLRSGNYKQATGSLFCQEEYGYCCLGVACLVNGYVKEEFELDGYINERFNVPKILKNSDVTNPLVKRLMRYNDDEGRDFKWIANWITRNL